MPTPSSRTSNESRAPSALAQSVTRPPRVNLNALLSRLMRTWRIFPASASTCRGSASTPSTSKVISASLARLSNIIATSLTSSCSAVGSTVSSTRSASIFDIART